MRTEAGGRGLQSLDSAALEKAKQIYKLAEKKGFSTVVERFDNDVEYTLASIRQGYDLLLFIGCSVAAVGSPAPFWVDSMRMALPSGLTARGWPMEAVICEKFKNNPLPGS